MQVEGLYIVSKEIFVPVCENMFLKHKLTGAVLQRHVISRETGCKSGGSAICQNSPNMYNPFEVVALLHATKRQLLPISLLNVTAT
jgi:hypothetical protein